MPVSSDSVRDQWIVHSPNDFNTSKTSVEVVQTIDVVDIRRAAVEDNVKEEISKLFSPETGPRRMPTILLYDERGLQLFEKITYLDEYYLTNCEIDILRRSAAEIARAIPSDSMVIEFGSGNLRKVILLLEALERAGKRIDYYALDLSRRELDRTLAQVPAHFKYVRCHGLHGTYDDGKEWLKAPANLARQKCLLSLGSSIGNFERQDAASFLRGIANSLAPTDMILLGLDACQNPGKVYRAYNDRQDVTHQFILNGLTHANRIMGERVFNEAEWEVIGEYVFDKYGGGHQAFYSPVRDTVVMGTVVRQHERIQVEQSLKYSEEESVRLWELSGLNEMQRWTTSGDDYGLHLLTKVRMPFSLQPSIYAASSLPATHDWKGLWDAWDVVTRGMLPSDELLEKPIRLRNACIFYLGHIPNFLDIQLTKTSGEPFTEPAWYRNIFERGIDPDVDNPELCHSHSEMPDEWPPVADILEYQEKVRCRLQELYSRFGDQIPRKIGQAIWAGFEHELMHIETLLYMMLQSDKTLPPPIAPRPNFEKLAEEAISQRVGNQWFTIPAQQIQIGLDDPDPAIGNQNRHYGWDNEKPARQTMVHSFQAQGRPITNEEYAKYMYFQDVAKLPASWSQSSLGGSNNYKDLRGSNSFPASFLNGKAVRTVYGLVPLGYALDWPIFASFDELSGCATWMGGRIPTFEEARSIYEHVNILNKKEAERTLGKTVPAVNGHLVNNGVEETPPITPPSEVNEECPQHDLFTDLDGANVGFQHWHPLPVTGQGNKLAGQAGMGGVWEWTSSTLERYEGFEPLALYPEYTADFFDGKHNIVLGGSWATHPRIAGRKTFVNWYQRNYPYAWAGARLVRDA